jgi:zinc ribbon protein
MRIALSAHAFPAEPGPTPAPPATAPQASPLLPHETAVTHSLVAAGGEQCPSCGAHVAPDQRYCLHCGARCGEPRLPFMNAVTFMEAMKPRPEAPAAPPKRPRRSLSPNAALIATIGTLLLAMGVGVLIGRSNNSSSTGPTQAATPIVIKGGGAEETTTPGTSTGETKTAGGGSAKKPTKKALKQEAQTQAGAEEFLKTAKGAKPLAKPTQELGGSCEKGTAGCSKTGKFEGNFFGEE